LAIPLIFVGDKEAKIAAPSVGALSDIAPTLLYMMGLEKPEEMTGNSLLTFN